MNNDDILNVDPELPPVPPALLEYLRKTFPLEGYKNVKNLEELQRYNGVQELIDHLTSLEESSHTPSE